ncbi:MAG: hypothetical protein KGK01_02075 [Bradyrhizobium sp.]|uniref:DUF5985 family protein n=1 Tax=Bradyrhizobium sp. TaxID=376 RepID=UPI001C291E97|nr:DUF5985 family protein [Bradyrhizobium sp.]MBU6463595.1 hypothetical protein [Pseudomonadota bacterium]MDE2067019.1 hypothetical protein [Bradyrhizobium sp.]MDE2241251.1 hypothetical protein [Bradyrhizobium sp.]MDE2472392.1 hypothetical protein [Bradyrhizobium sp.]
MEHLSAVLAGATAFASLVAALYFLKFWRKTRDTLFLFFAAAFTIDAIARFTHAIVQVTDSSEPVYFIPRLVTFGLIALSIIGKNALPNSRK